MHATKFHRNKKMDFEGVGLTEKSEKKEWINFELQESNMVSVTFGPKMENFRGRSRTASTSKTEFFVIIVNG